MDENSIRRENLRALIAWKYPGKGQQAAFAAFLSERGDNVSSSYISRCLSTSKNPKSIKNIGAPFARRIEDACGLDKYTMDKPGGVLAIRNGSAIPPGEATPDSAQKISPSIALTGYAKLIYEELLTLTPDAQGRLKIALGIINGTIAPPGKSENNSPQDSLDSEKFKGFDFAEFEAEPDPIKQVAMVKNVFLMTDQERKDDEERRRRERREHERRQDGDPGKAASGK